MRVRESVADYSSIACKQPNRLPPRKNRLAGYGRPATGAITVIPLLP